MPTTTRRLELRRRAVLQALTSLPFADRLSIVADELKALGAPLGTTDAHLAQLGLRQQALEALGQVAAFHQLPEGVAPKVREFKEASGQCALAATLSQVIDAYGHYRTAQDVFLGRTPPDTAATAARRRQSAGRRRNADDYLVPVSIWLAEQPCGHTTRAFDRWVAEYNATLGPHELPAVYSKTIRAQTGLRWAEAKALARGDAVVAVSSEHSTRPPAFGVLVATGGIANILGLTERLAYLESRKPEFPTRVAVLAGTALYRGEDVEAYGRGDEIEERTKDELNDAIVVTREVGTLLGIRLPSVRVYLSRRRFHLIPEPAGRAGGRSWWWRADVERFRATSELARARRRRNREQSSRSL